MDAKLEEVREQLAASFGMEVDEVHGWLYDLFLQAEKVGTDVYWGCWSAQELEFEF